MTLRSVLTCAVGESGDAAPDHAADLFLLAALPFPSRDRDSGISTSQSSASWDLISKMSAVNDGSSSPQSQHASRCFDDLLESIIVDVASECHRIARLGLDRNLEEEEEELRLSAQARVVDPGSSCESNSKNVVDIFGQTHPAIATDTFDCMNCGRPITAGRFAPHLEKCMGKGRKARPKATRSSTIARNRHSRSSPVTVYAPYSSASNSSRVPNGITGATGEEFGDYAYGEP